VLKTRIYFKYIKGKKTGKMTKLDFRKTHLIAGFVSLSDGINKKAYQVSFARYKPRKKRITPEIKARIFSAMREAVYREFTGFVKAQGKKIQKRNIIVYGSHYTKTFKGLHDWFIHDYKENKTGETIEDMFYDEHITDKHTNYVEVKRVVNETDKKYIEINYRFKSNPDNHPSFILQNTDFNDFDDAQKYNKVLITFSITFIGVGGKEFTLPEHIYTFSYFDELYKVQNKWLLEVKQRGGLHNFYTPTGLTLGKMREEMANMGWSMSGSFYQATPDKPYNTSPTYTVNVNVRGFYDTGKGAFNKIHTNKIHSIVDLDRKQREAFRRDVPEAKFSSSRLAYYKDMSRRKLWQYYTQGKSVKIKIGRKNYIVRPFKYKKKNKKHK
jgi:hypothetical protein